MVDLNPDPNSAHVLLIVDHSGSMMSIKDDAEGGIAGFLDQQRNLHSKTGEKIEVTVSLAQFNHEFEWVTQNTRINDVDPYLLRPSGTTALLDAVGRGVTEDLRGLGLRSGPPPGKTVCVIVTDGQENSSREWDQDGVKKLIEAQKSEHGWEFSFLATDITTIKMGRNIGAETTQFPGTGAGTRSAYRVTGQSVSSYLSGTSTRVDNPDKID